jgi:hypothetical protein
MRANNEQQNLDCLEVKKEMQAKSKKTIFILSLLFIGFLATSCSKEPVIIIEDDLLIKEYLDIEPFFYESEKDSVLLSYAWKILTINSIGQLEYYFEALGLEAPERIRQFDYEKYTFLLRFCLYSKIEGVTHAFKRDNETGIYKYLLILHQSEEINRSDFFCFYTGILVDKISDESEIMALMTTIQW